MRGERKLNALQARPLQSSRNWIPSEKVYLVIEQADDRWIYRLDMWLSKAPWARFWRKEVASGDQLGNEAAA